MLLLVLFSCRSGECIPAPSDNIDTGTVDTDTLDTDTLDTADTGDDTDLEDTLSDIDADEDGYDANVDCDDEDATLTAADGDGARDWREQRARACDEIAAAARHARRAPQTL